MARVAVDVLRERDEARALVDGARLEASQAAVWGSLVAVLTLLVGAGIGVFIGHYVVPR